MTAISGSSVTVRDVAREAGVSVMSVSNVINGRRVGPATHQAVTLAIQKLNYVPNPTARQLARRSGLTIGIAHGPSDHPFSSAMLLGALTAADRCGAQLILQLVPTYDPDAGWSAVNSLRQRGAKAVLLPAVLADLMAQQGHPEIGLPMMAVAPGGDLGAVASIRIDEFAAARDMTNLLISKGHRRVALIRAHPGSAVREARCAGYLDALRTHGVSIMPELIEDGQMTFESGLRAAGALLDLVEPPTAIFASNDDMAAGALVAAHIRHLSIPDKIMVAGFDDSYLAPRLWPALSSVRLPVGVMAEKAIEMLVEQIRAPQPGRASSGRSVFVDHQIIRRASTGD